jgi:hypothetical protein
VGGVGAECCLKFMQKITNFSKSNWLKIEIILIIFLLASYWLYKYLGDPQWPVKLVSCMILGMSIRVKNYDSSIL